MVRRCAGLALALVLALAPVAGAQTVAELSGRVADSTGGALPGVTVTVTQTDTGFTRVVVTGAQGEYVFNNLPVGPYRLSARLEGFSAYEQTGIVLAVGESRAVNVTLTVGVAETVSVQADATLVESRDVGVGRLVEREQIVSLPLNGRDVNQLVILAGNAVEIGGTSGDRAYPGAAGISVAGGTSNSTNYLVDGGYNNDPQQNSGNAMPFPDALQEFSVETGVRSARYGQSTGATVNAVTRAGTNQLHGGAFEFVRHHRFNAISFFERSENGGLGQDDGLKRAQTGGTLGGPIIRDTLFFFGGVQITNTRIAPLDSDQIVPTQEVRNGDFRRIMSPTCRNRTTNLTLGAPYVNNQVNPALFHPISVKIMNLLPLPDPALDPDGCGRYVAAIPNDSDEQQYIGRVDYNLAGNHRTFGRFFYSKYHHAPLFDIETNPNLIFASGNGLGNDAVMRTFAGGWDWVVSSSLFSSLRVSVQSTATARVQGRGLPTYTELGVNTFQYTTKPGQNFMRNGNAGWSANGLTGTFDVLTPSVSQDFDWIKGSHSLSFGGSWTRPHSIGDGTFQSNGQVGFSGIFTSGTSNANGGLNMADFVLGYVSSFSQGGSQLNDQILHSVGAYVQDVWRVNNNLTLNLGLRWEPYITAVDQNGFNAAFVRERFEQGLKSVTYSNAPAGLVFPGDPGFEYLADGKNHPNKWNKWAPRFGLVWDPRGDTQQTIRVGVGHYYDAPKLWTYAHHVLNSPYGLTATAIAANAANCPAGFPTRNGCPLPFEDPWRFTPGGDPLTGRLARQGEPLPDIPADVAFPLNAHYASAPTDTENMQVTQYNVAYERQLPGRMMVDITYMGSRTRNIWIGYEENPAVYIPGNCAPGQFPGVTAAAPACSNTSTNNLNARAILTLLNPAEGQYYQRGNIDQLFSEGKGEYNSVRIGLQKRMSDGWSVNANYTRSKCLNHGEPAVDINNVFPVPQRDPYNDPRPDTSTNWGPCAADRPHLLNLSSIVISPGVGSGIVNTITRDWQVGVIYQARSGSALTPSVSGENALTGNPQRPFIVPGVDPYIDEPFWVPDSAGFNTRLQWINMDAFRFNTPGEWGDVPKGYLRGPGYWNVDLSFSRNINFSAGRRAELRIEAFNLFDHVNWSNPNVQLGNANAGRITGTSGDPRIMQFAIKYNF
jgi:outer membrane receptor protein involved in Fe transport